MAARAGTHVRSRRRHVGSGQVAQAATPAQRVPDRGAAAAIATWNGAAIAAQPFTHHNPSRTAESATEAQCRCTKTNNAKQERGTRRRERHHFDLFFLVKS